ncbi:hypothetical protein [Paenibacillus sp. FSL L8-0708]|uniref:hypothetical protein n=1 Tax=Paenibacillus sp. FSL L8-0708 TaxID=2975311 RepID=UPI0030FA945A
MPKTTMNILQVLQELGAGPKLPNAHFKDKYKHLNINYRYFSDYYPCIMDALIELEPVIGKKAVLELMEQVLWRVLEGRGAVGDFLQVVFGEVTNLSEPK